MVLHGNRREAAKILPNVILKTKKYTLVPTGFGFEKLYCYVRRSSCTMVFFTQNHNTHFFRSKRSSENYTHCSGSEPDCCAACPWNGYGIRCSAGGRVDAVSLRSNALTGTIPAGLGDLVRQWLAFHNQLWVQN